jgi:hypothetical protein
MTHHIDTNLKVSDNAEFYFDDCADPVQTGAKQKLLGRAGRSLGLWLAAQLQAHHNRVFALGVYRRNRVDGPQAGDNRS